MSSIARQISIQLDRVKDLERSLESAKSRLASDEDTSLALKEAVEMFQLAVECEEWREADDAHAVIVALRPDERARQARIVRTRKGIVRMEHTLRNAENHLCELHKKEIAVLLAGNEDRVGHTAEQCVPSEDDHLKNKIFEGLWGAIRP